MPAVAFKLQCNLRMDGGTREGPRNMPCSSRPFDRRGSDLPESEASWESVASINQQFPAFCHEDKVTTEPRGNDKPRIGYTCSRRMAGSNRFQKQFLLIYMGDLNRI